MNNLFSTVYGRFGEIKLVRRGKESQREVERYMRAKIPKVINNSNPWSIYKKRKGYFVYLTRLAAIIPVGLIRVQARYFRLLPIS